MNINVMLSVTLSDECKDYRDDMNEALKNEGWEKIDIVNTVWFRVFSFDNYKTNGVRSELTEAALVVE